MVLAKVAAPFLVEAVELEAVLVGRFDVLTFALPFKFGLVVVVVPVFPFPLLNLFEGARCGNGAEVGFGERKVRPQVHLNKGDPTGGIKIELHCGHRTL